MDLLSRAQIIKYHTDFIKEFGIHAPQALGWKEKENQEVRFEALSGLIDLRDRSVLDIGCGKGDFLDFLSGKNIHCDYTGIDQIKVFIELASERYRTNKSAAFLLGDFWTADLGKYDYVIASGALSYQVKDQNFIYKMISRLFSLSKIAFAFNLMEKAEINNSLIATYDKKEILDFCRKLSSNVLLKDDYLEGDFTLIMC
jgi:SAM-dependent methyltransferase